MALLGLVLDSVQPDLLIEEQVAAEMGARLVRWDGADAQLADADFVVHVRTRVTADLIARLTKCRAIGRYGVGLDTVDTAAAAQRGIAVVRVPEYATLEVAEHALTLGLAVARGIGSMGTVHPRDAWNLLQASPRIGLEGPIGVLGFGNIGQQVSRLWSSLGFQVLVTCRDTAPISQHPEYERVELGQLLRRCELVTLHVALTAATEHMIGRDQLSLMTADAILVNTARGGLVDSTALLDALQGHQIRGAGLDVLETDGVDWWAKFAAGGLNVVLTPHIAWYSPRSIDRLRREVVQLTVRAATGPS